MEVRKLTESEREELQDVALEVFHDDTRQDAQYATDTVRHLAEEKGDAWWCEFLSSDPDCVIEHLSFNPYQD